MYSDHREHHDHCGRHHHDHHGEHGHVHGGANGHAGDDPNLVCPCVGVTKTDIEQAVANDARTLEDVGNATGAGTHCGRCVGAVEACLQETLAAQAS
ncbi:(2Fe-2S)-binding protein [Olsenella sp. Marseille-P4559]|uniref:(2Fe-2S)-binding protein n=1 Tax=Olsenella sp. Marseille-P4559 TaxID=2364795 RepID=UPI0010320C9A|nr:(2Fe-2S)-binding protein [Olsenella sp. Marseille-P4559]